jgi:hypothetical protein
MEGSRERPLLAFCVLPSCYLLLTEFFSLPPTGCAPGTFGPGGYLDWPFACFAFFA